MFSLSLFINGGFENKSNTPRLYSSALSSQFWLKSGESLVNLLVVVRNFHLHKQEWLDFESQMH